MKTKAVEALTKRYLEVGGKIFADFFIRNKASDETKKKIEVMGYMLANCESFLCEFYFTRKDAIKAKKDWERNWDESYEVITVRITQVVGNKKR